MISSPRAPSPDTVLQGSRVRLEPLGRHHAPALAEVAFDPEIWKWTQTRIDSPADLERYLDEALEQRARGLGVPFVAIEPTSGRAIGSTRYMNIDVANRRLEIGWTWLALACHRTGINREMKYLMLRHAFEELGLARVEFKANAVNARSRTALRALGAKEEGVFRQWRVGADGRLHDTAWYSILAEEWPALRAALEKGLSNMAPI